MTDDYFTSTVTTAFGKVRTGAMEQATIVFRGGRLVSNAVLQTEEFC